VTITSVPALDAFAGPAPIYTGSKPGPWFSAAFPGICEKGGEGFEAGDEVRADGEGGYECRDCVTDAEQPPEPTSWERPTAANVKMPESSSRPAPDLFTAPAPDLFTAPAPVAIVAPAEREDDPLTNRYGYLIKDPRTGEYNRYKNGNVKPFTRTSTLVKAASNQKGITDWEQRNVVMGAVLRPDLLTQARGLNHEDHKDQLQAIARMLGEAAGSRSGSDAGTMFHTITEHLDAGTATLDQVPEEYRELARKYKAALDEAGFRVVPDMIEQVVFLGQYGGIGGKFDRVLFHEPTGTYVMADVKSGKSMDFGWSEIEAQEWTYATAYNEFGTWDHKAKVWHKPKVRVATDYGLVMHTPVKGKLAGQVSLLRTDLARGGRHAELCATVRAADSVQAKPVAWSAPDDWSAVGRPTEAPRQITSRSTEVDWDREFSRVTHRDQAGKLWVEAKESGVDPMELNRLVQLAQSALRVVGVSG
jgi:hypothetical protein